MVEWSQPQIQSAGKRCHWQMGEAVCRMSKGMTGGSWCSRQSNFLRRSKLFCRRARPFDQDSFAEMFDVSAAASSCLIMSAHAPMAHPIRQHKAAPIVSALRRCSTIASLNGHTTLMANACRVSATRDNGLIMTRTICRMLQSSTPYLLTTSNPFHPSIVARHCFSYSLIPRT